MKTALLATIAAAALLTGCGGSSEASQLDGAVSAAHADAICGKVGVMAFAGGRSNLYGCTWGYPATTRHCLVWANGGAYEVTGTARTLFRAQGAHAPC